MHSEGNEVHISEEEASGGSKEGVVRWVLIFGLILGIGALSLVWITGAAYRDDPDADNANVSAKIAAERARAADGLAAQIPTSSAERDDTTVQNGENVVEN